MHPDVPDPAHDAQRPGAESRLCCAGPSSPWPGPFPPSPPPPVARPCSGTSSVLRACPTAPNRASSACVLGLPDAARRLHGRPVALPVLVRGASLRARGQRPRGTPRCLAVTTPRMWPSASLHSVGVPKFGAFRGSIPGPHLPLSTLRARPRGRTCMTRGRCGSLLLHRMALSSTAPRRFIPAHGGRPRPRPAIPPRALARRNDQRANGYRRVSGL